MLSLISKYTHWLHTQWPDGTVEKGPEVNDDGTTRIPGVRVIGDLRGFPLLKFSADTGAKAVRAILEEANFTRGAHATDLIIVGAGVSGLAAAIEAKRNGLSFRLLDASQSFSTIKNFPKGKPIYTYPTDMTPAGGMEFTAKNKEALVDELEAQRQAADIESESGNVERISKSGDTLVAHLSTGETMEASRILVAIGRTGKYRRLGVSGEDLPKVRNRLIDPNEFTASEVVVVGGGDSALEAAISLAEAGASVCLVHRGAAFTRPKPENIEAVQRLAERHLINLSFNTTVRSISPSSIELVCGDKVVSQDNDFVFTLTGREAPLDFFRKSAIPIKREFTLGTWLSLAGMLIFTTLFYHWQKGVWFQSLSPAPLAHALTTFGGLMERATETPSNLLHHLRNALSQPGFYYSFAYSVCVVVFGIRRVKRSKTPYVKWQTLSLASFQILPLFLLPWILLPWTGALGWWDHGIGGWIGQNFWPNQEYWRAFGLVLAWPLFVYNWFTSEPLWGWLILGFLQTFVLIPLIVWRWGKGAYCGWICSCGALAETLGDTHRKKMPHGPFWNKLNMVGQALLAIAAILFLVRIVGWIMPDGNFAERIFNSALSGLFVFNWKYAVDLWIAGVLGIAFYFHFSGRVWCRFACPLAALMHIYSRFSRFRIFTDKNKCISCNVCTSVCHQGIDIMNFASKGKAMEDPQCVRCSACVQSCPTGVLNFGRLDSQGNAKHDTTPASLVHMVERAIQADREKASQSTTNR